jgi:acyl-CoA reductase-like NAD-dependent aldehyde dehydrogenase
VARQAELPAGILNIVFGDGATTGSALVKHPKVKGISFTGGTATGIQIRRDTAGDIYKHLSLELGGKNPTLVFDDVDIEKAVATAAMAAFENQGEASNFPFSHHNAYSECRFAFVDRESTFKQRSIRTS